MIWRIDNFFFRLKCAWQRLVRGWDDRVWWDLDSYLCQMLPIWLRELKDGHSHPMHLIEGEWRDILEKMAQGFEAGRRLRDGLDIELGDEDKFNRAMDLFREWFFDLWD